GARPARDTQMEVRTVVVVIFALLAAACGDGAAPGADLAVDVRDLAVVDLGLSGCPPTYTMFGPCRVSGAVCRYPTDAGPYDHLRCNGSVWQPGDCPFGPGYATEFSGCTARCTEYFGEAITTCTCLPNGTGVCCIDTGGQPNCGNFDAGP
ncbi:MAG: hypothetical protein ACXVAN_16310, partial [Polyangia bacterium]